jgi:hypothetical protein
MRKRLLVASAAIIIGLFLIAYSLTGSLSIWALPIGNALSAGVGIILILVGIVLLLTEVLESFLTRGQKALVDGLQAG